MNESKHDKFKRLAEQRGNRILHYLRLLSNLSNKSNYDYSEAEVRQMFSTIDHQLRVTKQNFASPTKKIRL